MTIDDLTPAQRGALDDLVHGDGIAKLERAADGVDGVLVTLEDGTAIHLDERGGATLP